MQTNFSRTTLKFLVKADLYKSVTIILIRVFSAVSVLISSNLRPKHILNKDSWSTTWWLPSIATTTKYKTTWNHQIPNKMTRSTPTMMMSGKKKDQLSRLLSRWLSLLSRWWRCKVGRGVGGSERRGRGSWRKISRVVMRLFWSELNRCRSGRSKEWFAMWARSVWGGCRNGYGRIWRNPNTWIGDKSNK